MIEEGPSFWTIVLFPLAVLLILWGAILPEGRFLHDRFGAPYATTGGGFAAGSDRMLPQMPREPSRVSRMMSA
jgi:hypothetical protein